MGVIIFKIIEKYNGKKIIDNNPSFWSTNINDSHIGDYKLPQTSAQYLIDIDRLPEIYADLNNY